MEKPIDGYFLNHNLEISTCLQFLRAFIPKIHPLIQEEWKYGMPFFSYNGKNFIYLWVHKKLNQPYIGFVDGAFLNHPKLILEKRKSMKIFLIDPYTDVDINEIKFLILNAIDIRKSLVSKK